MQAALDKLADFIEHPENFDTDTVLIIVELLLVSARTFPVTSLASVAIDIVKGDRAAALVTTLIALGAFTAIELQYQDVIDEVMKGGPTTAVRVDP
jgi:hypothetical protein